jgi:hypothetical protein
MIETGTPPAARRGRPSGDRYLKGDKAALARLRPDASVVGETTLQADAGSS